MMVKFLDLTAQYKSIHQEIDRAIAQTIERSSFIGGPDVAGFEKEFAKFQEAQYCVGVGNGTDAIEIVIEAFDFPIGSEIIVPANSFIASSEAVTRAGHHVIFCEPDPETYLLDAKGVAGCITSRTAAILCVHLYGQPCDMNSLRALADGARLKIIEDAAQAHGAEDKGRRVGSIGDAGTFSFYPGKNLGAYGDGGAITTNDEHLARKCRMLANHGRIDKYNHQFEGRNSRLDGLQAAILRAKLPHLDGWIDHRNKLAGYYLEQLDGIDGLVLPAKREAIRHAYHLFVVRTAKRDRLQAHLREEGIETGIHYPMALPDLAAYAHRHINSTQARELSRTVLSLPMGEHLQESDIDTVVASVRRFFRA